MSYDFAAYVVQQFHLVEQTIHQRSRQEIQQRTVQRLGERPSKTEINQIRKDTVAKEAWGFVQQATDGDLRLADQVLSLIQMRYKVHKEYRDGIRQAWIAHANKSLTASMQMNLFAEFSSVERRLSTVLPILPRYSWYISLPVRLEQPFTSKDDSEMHVLENPVCRERIFGVPMVRPSTWKGNLRWMAVMASLDREVRERLFGNETDVEEEFRAGRLFFFPTFFDRIDFEVLTPLDRERRFPRTGPIFLECVCHRSGNEAKAGELGLLYLAPPGAWQKPAEVAQQAASDLKHTTTILTEILLFYGFSAKKTSGFGVIEDNFRDEQGHKLGTIALVGVLLPEAEVPGPGVEFTTLPIVRLPFGNCAEMYNQAERLAQAMEEASHE